MTSTNCYSIFCSYLLTLCYLCTILGVFMLGEYIGSMVATNRSSSNTSDCEKDSFILNSLKKNEKEEVIKKLVQKRIKGQNNDVDHLGLFQSSRSTPLKSLSFLRKEDFTDYFDMGMNFDNTSKGMERVLMFFDTQSSKITAKSTKEATQYCESMQIIGNTPITDNQCLGYFENYDSYHLLRWMRNNSKVLRHVGRGQELTRNVFQTPLIFDEHHSNLLKYLNTIDHSMKQLKIILSEMTYKEETIVVMVCSQDEIQLLQNFICSMKAHDFDLNNILLFATDSQIHTVAQKLGLKAFLLSSTQMQMHWAKVNAAHLVAMLNLNFLMTSPDVMWNHHPLDYFRNQTNLLSKPTLLPFDIFFQDNTEIHHIQTAPYNANSDFYYASSNDRTRYFFTSMLYSSDLLYLYKSHEQAMTAFIAEHNNLYTLRVKTLPLDLFPTLDDSYTKRKDPIVLHIHSESKQVFQNMGLWYLLDSKSCNLEDCCSLDSARA